jgi:hypothetical protein
MLRFLSRKRLFQLGLPALALLAAGLVAYLERVPLTAWYVLGALSSADGNSRAAWADRAARLGEAAVPGLLRCLERGDDRACGNACLALDRFSRPWPADDPRWPPFAGRLADAFPRFSTQGQRNALLLAKGWVGREWVPASVEAAAGRLVHQSAHAADPGAHAAALELATALLAPDASAEVVGDCREMLTACLRDADPQTRIRAIRLAAGNEGLGLLEAVVPLLDDADPKVRCEAMLAARNAPEAVVKTDHLLRWLHDPDDDVRRICEALLRGRGMTEEHLKLGRLLTDPRPSVRLQVLDYLHPDSDLEPGVWLRLLTADPEPAVRVAAVRAAVADPLVDLTDRIDQMTQGDPSPTVCQLARYYLSCQQKRNQAAPDPQD